MHSVPAKAAELLTLLPLLAAVEEIERDLPATSGEFSLSISLFILFQGLFPFGWSMVSELKGRRVSAICPGIRLIYSYGYVLQVCVPSVALNVHSRIHRGSC